MRLYRRLILTPDFAGVARRYCFAEQVAREALEGGSQNAGLFLMVRSVALTPALSHRERGHTF